MCVGHALDSFQVIGWQAGVEISDPRGGLVRVVLHQQDGQAGGRGRPGELADPGIGGGPRAQQQAGQAGSAQLGEVGGHDDVVPVAGHHHQPSGVQGMEAAGNARGEDRHVPDAPGHVALVQDLRVQVADQVADPRPRQLGTVRHRRGDGKLPPGQGGPQPGRRGGIGGGQAVDHAADHPRLLAGHIAAGRDGELLGQFLRVAIRGPAAGQHDVGVERTGQRLVQRAGIQPRGPRAEALDHDHVGPAVDRLPGRDDLLQHDVQLALAEQFLQLGGGDRLRGPQRGDRGHQFGRLVRAAVGPGLGHRLDVRDLDAPPVQGTQQPQARPGHGGMIGNRRDEQAAGHVVLLSVTPGGHRRRDESRGVAGDQQFLIGRHDQRQDGPGTADPPAGVAAVPRVSLRVLG